MVAYLLSGVLGSVRLQNQSTLPTFLNFQGDGVRSVVQPGYSLTGVS